MEHLPDYSASHGVSAVKDFQVVGSNTVQNITAGDSARVHNGHVFNKTVILRSYTLERDLILDWLSTLSFSKAHERVRDGASLHDQSHIASPARYPGKWLLESQAFVDWITGDNDKLWYIGMPGVGKSVLASIIIERLRPQGPSRRLEVQHSESSGEQVAYLYLNYNEAHSTESLLGSVIRQLVQHNEVMPQAVRDLWQHRSRGKEPPTLRDLTELLNIIHRDLEKPNYVVVDALDECPFNIRTRLIKALQPNSGNLKILVISRHMDVFMIEAQRTFCIKTIEAHQDDLDFFMDVEMHRTQVLKQIWEESPELRASVKSTVEKRCCGMYVETSKDKMLSLLRLFIRFLLASLQMEHIVSSLRKSDVRDKLRTLPTDADEAYQKSLDMIDKLDETQKKLTLDIFAWIVFSCRPLSMEELRHALAVEPGQSTFDVERLYDADLIRNICGGLVSVDNGKVAFANYPAHAFFSRKLTSRFPGFHSAVSLTLVTYLSLKHFEQPDNIDCFVSNPEDRSWGRTLRSMRDLHVWGYLDGRKKLGFDSKLRWFPLLRYAADYLGYHIRQQHDPVLQDSMVNSFETLLRSGPGRRFLVRLFTHPHRHLKGPRLSFSSRDNFWDDEEPDVFDSDASSTLIQDMTALGDYAAEHTAKWLEQILDGDNGDEENGHDSNSPTLQTSSSDVSDDAHFLKSETSSRALTPALSHTSEVSGNTENALDAVGGGIGGHMTTPDTTALHVACYLGWKPLVERLLESSELLSEINQRDEDAMTPVNYAVIGAFWDIVNLLIANGASIDLAANEGHYILLHAARSNRKDVLQRVVSQAFHENQAIKSGLAMAFGAGNTRMRHLRKSLCNFLTHFTPLHIKRRKGTTAVTPATKYYHLRLLLAALNGDMTMVRQLLENGHVDLQDQSSHFPKTALFLAVEFGHVDFITEMVHGGTNVDTRGIHGCTPLQRATARNDVPMVRTLLGKKASVAKRDYRGGTARLANAHHRHEEVLRILQNFGADPNIQDKDGVTRLYEASAGGDLSTVAFFLQQGDMSPSLSTDYGWAPLHWAAHNGHLGCVRVLLEHGANPNPVSDQSTTPLDMARQTKQHAIANILLAAGAKTAWEVLQSTGTGSPI